MSKFKYARKRNVIRSAKGDEKFASVALAKQRSRELQLAADGALGRGSLKVVDKLPKMEVHHA